MGPKMVGPILVGPTGPKTFLSLQASKKMDPSMCVFESREFLASRRHDSDDDGLGFQSWKVMMYKPSG